MVDRFEPYLRERLTAYPALTALRLFREIKERGYSGGYSVVRDRVRDLRPTRSAGYEVRFETPPGEQAQVDFAGFEVEFVDEPGVRRIVWLLSMVLGYSRLIWRAFADAVGLPRKPHDATELVQRRLVLGAEGRRRRRPPSVHPVAARPGRLCRRSSDR
jgi:transposase